MSVILCPYCHGERIIVNGTEVSVCYNCEGSGFVIEGSKEDN